MALPALLKKEPVAHWNKEIQRLERRREQLLADLERHRQERALAAAEAEAGDEVATRRLKKMAETEYATRATLEHVEAALEGARQKRAEAEQEADAERLAAMRKSYDAVMRRRLKLVGEIQTLVNDLAEAERKLWATFDEVRPHSKVKVRTEGNPLADTGHRSRLRMALAQAGLGWLSGFDHMTTHQAQTYPAYLEAEKQAQALHAREAWKGE